MRLLKETGKINLDEKFIEALEYEELEESKENSVIELRDITANVTADITIME